jgi:hypothetical protein
VSLARFQEADQGDYQAGFEVSGALGKVGFRVETAVNVMERTRDWDVEAVVGVDYRFPFKLLVAAEVFYNGYGAKTAAGYAALASDPGQRVMRGETFSLGRYYAGLTLDQELHPLLHISLSTLFNAADPSALVIPALKWSVIQDAHIIAGMMIPIGRKPEDMVMQSEFGTMPLAGYLVMRLAF